MRKHFSELGLLLRIPYTCSPTHCCLIDVGAHIGGFASQFARKDWQVIAFEPEPLNYKALCDNLLTFQDAICINKAVSDVSEQEVQFYVSTDHYGIHSLKPFHETHQPKLSVETVRLDETLRELNITQVTILKTDIEGADLLAIKGFDFEQYRPEVVICEFKDDRSMGNFGYTHHDMAGYMQLWGYTCFVSEWAPIVEYARKNEPADTHRFIQCLPYPLDHQPAWGNLIFVPDDRVEQFERTLRAYMRFVTVASIIKLIPGSTTLYQKHRG